MSQARTRPPGEGGEELTSAFEHSVEEGEVRLHRSLPGLLATGTLGGIDIGLGVFGLLLVLDATGDPLLAGLAFSIGFIVLVLAKSELFTENFLVPIVAVFSRRASPLAVLRLWSGTMATNFLGGWVVMAIIVTGFPELRDTAVELGGHQVTLGIGWRAFASALLGGMLMTLLTWMERSVESIPGRVVAAVGVGFLLGGGRVNHAVIASLEMFGALHVGAPFGYLDWAGATAWAALGNLVGGMGLVTALRLVQVGRETRARVRDGA